MTTTQFDVVLLGEPLVEVSTTEAFRHGVGAALGVSGDVVTQVPRPLLQVLR